MSLTNVTDVRCDFLVVCPDTTTGDKCPYFLLRCQTTDESVELVLPAFTPLVLQVR